jgi:hypothetical protein
MREKSDSSGVSNVEGLFEFIGIFIHEFSYANQLNDVVIPTYSGISYN